MVHALLQIDELPPEVTISFDLRSGLMIEIFVIRSDSFVNHPTYSKFELGEKVTTIVVMVVITSADLLGWHTEKLLLSITTHAEGPYTFERGGGLGCVTEGGDRI